MYNWLLWCLDGWNREQGVWFVINPMISHAWRGWETQEIRLLLLVQAVYVILKFIGQFVIKGRFIFVTDWLQVIFALIIEGSICMWNVKFSCSVNCRHITIIAIMVVYFRQRISHFRVHAEAIKHLSIEYRLIWIHHILLCHWRIWGILSVIKLCWGYICNMLKMFL